MNGQDLYDIENFVCQACGETRRFDQGSGDCQACDECCMCQFTLPGFRCFAYGDTKPKPFPPRKAILRSRDLWAGVAKANGWYAEPFFIQVWFDETTGKILDSVATRNLTADLFIPTSADDCDDECCMGGDDDE